MNTMTKQSYPDKLRTQVRQWQDKIDQLRAHIKQAGCESRREFEEQIQDLQAKQKAANRKLEQLERTGRSVRKASRARVEAARTKVQRAVRRLVTGFR